MFNALHVLVSYLAPLCECRTHIFVRLIVGEPSAWTQPRFDVCTSNIFKQNHQTSCNTSHTTWNATQKKRMTSTEQPQIQTKLTKQIDGSKDDFTPAVVYSSLQEEPPLWFFGCPQMSYDTRQQKQPNEKSSTKDEGWDPHGSSTFKSQSCTNWSTRPKSSSCLLANPFFHGPQHVGEFECMS